jgi:hypothetical protein
LIQLLKHTDTGINSGELEIDINATDDNGDTALHMAMMQAHPAPVKLLLKNGADVLGSGYEGSTVLMKPFFDRDTISRAYAGMDVVRNDPETDSADDRKEDDERIQSCLQYVINAILLGGEDTDRDGHRGNGSDNGSDGDEGDGLPDAKRRRV